MKFLPRIAAVVLSIKGAFGAPLVPNENCADCSSCERDAVIASYVTTIADDAFKGCSMDSVVVHDDVVMIGASAFEGSTIATATLGTGVSFIGDHSFASCLLLSTITLPDGVVSIGVGAFAETYSLTALPLPSSLTTLEDSTFYRSGLTAIEIPASITSIGASVFAEAALLTSVTFNEGLETIGDHAFMSSGVVSVDLPTTLTTLEEGAFSNCVDAVSASLPPLLLTLPTLAFRSCSSLASVTLQEGLVSIGDGAFNATGLTTVTIPATVTTIGSDAFKDNTQLSSVIFASPTLSALTTIGERAFAGCSSLSGPLLLPPSIDTVGAAALNRTAVTTATTARYDGRALSVGDFVFSGCSTTQLQGRIKVTVSNDHSALGVDLLVTCTTTAATVETTQQTKYLANKKKTERIERNVQKQQANSGERYYPTGKASSGRVGADVMKTTTEQIFEYRQAQQERFGGDVFTRINTVKKRIQAGRRSEL